jgi:hypothetical protein
LPAAASFMAPPEDLSIQTARDEQRAGWAAGGSEKSGVAP